MRSILLLAAATAACAPEPHRTTPHAGPPHWSYEGEEGTSHWAELAPDFALCAAGRQQSPIDLVAAAAGEQPEYRVAYSAHVPTLLNNGHTVQVDHPGGALLILNQERYELLQYHFHTPSEHTMDGVRFPMELHLVHRGASGLAVLGVLIREGSDNSAFAPLLAELPAVAGEVRTLRMPHHPASLLGLHGPDGDALRTFRYSGSLTTPPCSEGVEWHVLVQPVELSAGQIERLREVLHMNSRPVQPLHGRAVVLGKP